MTHITSRNVIEFLIGLIVLPRLVMLVWIFGVAYFSLEAQKAIFVYIGLSAVLIIIAFLIRKSVALGFLAGIIWDFVQLYLGS